jgi:hypothetical protein
MAGAKVRDGWLEVDCDAHDRAEVYVAATPRGAKEPVMAEWQPGFRDWGDRGQRVAKIRPPLHGEAMVWLKVDGNAIRLSKPVSL